MASEKIIPETGEHDPDFPKEDPRKGHGRLKPGLQPNGDWLLVEPDPLWAYFSPVCVYCEWLDEPKASDPIDEEERHFCKAFPRKKDAPGIPWAIWSGQRSHYKKFPGQENDVTFQRHQQCAPDIGHVRPHGEEDAEEK